MARPSTGLRWLLLLVAAGSIGTAAQFTRGRRAFTQEQFECRHPPPRTHAFLTLAPHGTPHAARTLVVHWQADRVAAGDWVGVFATDPDRNLTDPLVRLTPTRPAGRQATRLTVTLPTLNDVYVNDNCLGRWAAYMRDGRVAGARCLKIQPSWMVTSKDLIGDRRLRDVVLVGRRDAGAAAVDVWTQLMLGVRYLDVHVTHLPAASPSLWAGVRDGRGVTPLRAAVAQLRRFLRRSNEIVVLELATLRGLDAAPAQHAAVIDLLERRLGDWMAPVSLGPELRLNQLWNTGRRLLVTYNHRARRDSVFLWPPTPVARHPARNASQLRDFVDELMSRAPYRYNWTIDTCLTDDAPAAERAEARGWLSARLRQRWWDRANIVTTCDVLATDLVDAAIESNRRRHSCRQQAAAWRPATRRPTTTAPPTWRGPRAVPGRS